MSVRKRKKKGTLDKELERLYRNFSNKHTEPNDTGREQFIIWQSLGINPVEPDQYFIVLKEGKHWFNVQQSMIRDSYLTDDWWGFYTYHEDFKKTGELWILKHLFSWHEDLPKWFLKEKDDNIS